MDEVVKEALEYVSPKKIDESAADPRNKKAPAKGKTEDAAPVDLFEGKDTEEYKELANQIKIEYFGSSEEEVHDASKENILASRVDDDGLLV